MWTTINLPKHPARALREVVVSDLRERGFRGTFPHFRRILPTRIDLLTLQFYSAGGSFVVEIAQCGPEGPKTWRKVAPEKATVFDLHRRLRPGSEPPGRPEHWFVFGKPNYEPGHEHVHADEHYRTIANQVKELVRTQAESYWAEEAG